MTYAAEALWRELTYVAYYLHWSLDSLLDLDHPNRHRVISEIGRIHTETADEGW